MLIDLEYYFLYTSYWGLWK